MSTRQRFYARALLSFIIFSLLMAASCVKNDSPKTIDLTKNWRFSPDEKNIGMSEKWYAVDFDDSKWNTIDAGKDWETQGYPDLDGYGWYRKTVEIPADWVGKEVWINFSGVNDSYRLFINGKLLTSFGDAENTIFNSSTLSELSQVLKFGEKNLITVQVNDWGNSGGIWMPVEITVDKNRVDSDFMIYPFINYEKNTLLLNTKLASYISEEIKCDRINIAARKEGSSAIVAKQEVKLKNNEREFLARLDMPKTKDKTVYNISIDVIDPSGAIIRTLSKKVMWNPPSLQADKNGVIKLNNMVSELLNKDIQDQGAGDFKFYNPRKGWVFFSINTKNSDPEAKIDDNSETLVWRVNPESGTKEAMQLLDKGEHTLSIKQSPASKVIVRSIPELIFSDYPCSPNIEAYGEYDWEYLTKHVLSHVNTIVTNEKLNHLERDQWVKEGRQWIVHSQLVGLNDEKAPTVEEVTHAWLTNQGTTDPHFSGIIVDEFMLGGNKTAEHYRIWKESLTALYNNPAFKGKNFYAYCTPIFGAPDLVSIPFGKEVVKNGAYFTLERYLNELPTEDEAYSFIFSELSQTYRKMIRGLDVDGQKWIINLGYLTAPTETQSYYPFVDFRVYMDMQMHLLATDPTFNDLYGVQEYIAAYADEELIRWAHKLFRHYFIEGNRARYTDDPYILPHLKNSFFLEGLQGWTVEQAEKGSIEMQNIEGLSWLFGLYPRTHIGDQCVRFKRSAKKPNTIRQTIKKLIPGKLYSLKLVAADKNKMDKKQKLALSIKLKGVEIIKDLSFLQIYPTNYGHEVGEITRDNPGWFNFYRIVFRPKSETAELSISDWMSPSQPKGPAGQEIIFNSVEVQPYFAD